MILPSTLKSFSSSLQRALLLVIGSLAVACILLGAFWLQADRRQVHAVALLSNIDRLQQTPASQASWPFVIRATQLLPHFESLGIDTRTLKKPLARLVNGAPDTLVDVDQRLALVYGLTEMQSRLRYQIERQSVINQTRLKQVLTLLVSVFLVSLFLVGLSVRPSRERHLTSALLDSNPTMLAFDQTLFESVPVPLVFSDTQQKIIAVNNAYERLTGYPQADCVGQHVDFNLSGQQDDAFLDSMRDQLLQTDQWQGELWLRRESGEAFSEKVTRVSVRDENRILQGHLTISNDASNSDASKRLMLWQAHHDPLTKLANRNLLEDRLKRSLLSAGRRGALIVINLDHFKALNDSIGPSKGDQVLIETAYRLAMCAEETDTVSRLGADQFAVVVEDIEEDRQVEHMAQAIVNACREPFQSGDRQLFCSASVGVVLFPKDGDNSGELMQKADAACGLVKQKGGNNVGFFEPEINTLAERRLEIETQLRLAIPAGQLSLHLQPILDLEKNQVIGAEALLRWMHPELGFVSPAEFIPIAEDTRLIVAVGEWVVAETKRVQDLLDEAGIPGLRISLNVSAAQIRQPEDVERLLAAVDGLDTDNTTIELTESAIIDDAQGAGDFLKALSGLGCRVALDDFGTGFSSLGYLRDFEFDLLKVDKSFIDSLDVERDRGLVASIVSMGKIMGMKIVAEGVETLEQLEQLQQMNCDYIQGYHYSRPLPVPDFVDFVREQRPDLSGARIELAPEPRHG